MTHQYSIDQQVMEIIARSPGSALDDIVFDCPGLTWN
jgi:hypothetical protein